VDVELQGQRRIRLGEVAAHVALPGQALTFPGTRRISQVSQELSREVLMKDVVLNLPTFAFVVSTRAALAAGVALLVSDKLSAERRRKIGAMLVAVGATTTIPAVMSIRRSVRRSRHADWGVDRDERLIGATRFPRKGNDDVG
jgi:hypothetical protein